jgi:hypothetical protein
VRNQCWSDWTWIFDWVKLQSSKKVLILILKGRRSFFSNKCSNLPFLAQEAKMEKKSFFGTLTASTHGQRVTAGHRPACLAMFLCFEFYLFFWNFFGKFGRMGAQEPHFLKLAAPTLGSVKCSIPHGDWRFHFFSNFSFPKLGVHLNLHIYRWNFCLKKNWDHKKFHKNC